MTQHIKLMHNAEAHHFFVVCNLYTTQILSSEVHYLPKSSSYQILPAWHLSHFLNSSTFLCFIPFFLVYFVTISHLDCDKSFPACSNPPLQVAVLGRKYLPGKKFHTRKAVGSLGQTYMVNVEQTHAGPSPPAPPPIKSEKG